ncbi:MAG: hypothetical protein EOO51_13175 [Flavobacterium sp.]|nr:MAG: hypothetical protein EOO51_13175 [Flavobacterium sp.]
MSKKPVNVCVLSYEQDGKKFNATSASVESKDHAIEQALETFEKVQVENNITFKLLEIYSEWKPSDALLENMHATYPGLKITYSFQDGDEEKFRKAIQEKKWWQFWK